MTRSRITALLASSLVLVALPSQSAGARPRSATYSQVVLADSPIMYWRLGELSGTTAFDASGHSRDATYFGGPHLGSRGAIVGDTDTAAGFNGRRDIVQWTPDATVSGIFSVEAWIKPLEDSAQEYDFFSTRSPGEFGFDFKLTGTSFTGVGKSLYVDVGDGKSWLVVGYENARVNFNYRLKHWYHVVAVVTPSGVTLYAQGLTRKTIAYTGIPLLYDSSHFVLLATGGFFWHGGLDEIAVYDYALTADQVAAHYSAGISP